MTVTPTLEVIDGDLGLYAICDQTNGYLIVRGKRSLLVDCPCAAIGELCRSKDLPIPEFVLHTQVQEEHCHEWQELGTSRVHVGAESRELAVRSEKFERACETTWADTDDWAVSLGEEEYGVAGCCTERPPQRALNVAGVLEAGKPFVWEDLELTILPLPGAPKRSIGLWWPEHGILFSGDLMRAGGFLVNMYDLERCYGDPRGYRELRSSIERVLALAPRKMLPSTGPATDDPVGDCRRLLERTGWVLSPPARRADEPEARLNHTPVRDVGKYTEVTPGVYQSNNAGNVILFVDDDGRGLMIDPDPCIWTAWDGRCREFSEDLDMLEREAGLKTVELAAFTHYHGDHVEYSDLLRERYGTRIAAAPDVADLVERPREFPYPCTLEWYAFPFDRLSVDRRIAYEEPLDWHGVKVVPVRAAGHCWAQTGYLIEWRGRRIACTGDSLQYGAGPIRVPLPVIYNDTAWPERGLTPTLKRLREFSPDMVLCGHSMSFTGEVDAILAEWQLAADQSEGLASAMLHDGDLMRAMTPPGYDDVRRRLST